MKTSIRQTVLLCGTLCTAITGWKMLPAMDAVQIGTYAEQQPDDAAAIPVSEIPPLSDTAYPAESGIVTQPDVQAPPEPPPPVSANIINLESEGSAAMWLARPYQETQSGDGGEIVCKHFGMQNGDPFFALPAGGQVRNTTFWNNQELLEESRIKPELPLKIDGTPMVLIYHTHTTESYVSDQSGHYDASFNFRTTDPEKNMVMVGNAIAEQLAAAGIGVVHAKEIHDYPVWTGSYHNSAVTIQSVLEQYPSVCIALDIHRDAITNGTTVTAPVADINGRQSAQIMIISGCDDGTMDMPEYRKNFHLASMLQQTAETMFPGFTRPILFDYRKYNQNLTNGSLLIEVGSQGNTLEEARFAGECTGKVLAETIRILCSESAATEN